MKKETFIFPTYESMWKFKDQAKAINVEIMPKKNTISGLFAPQDIELAMGLFQASKAEAFRQAV